MGFPDITCLGAGTWGLGGYICSPGHLGRKINFDLFLSLQADGRNKVQIAYTSYFKSSRSNDLICKYSYRGGITELHDNYVLSFLVLNLEPSWMVVNVKGPQLRDPVGVEIMS